MSDPLAAVQVCRSIQDHVYRIYGVLTPSQRAAVEGDMKVIRDRVAALTEYLQPSLPGVSTHVNE